MMMTNMRADELIEIEKQLAIREQAIINDNEANKQAMNRLLLGNVIIIYILLYYHYYYYHHQEKRHLAVETSKLQTEKNNNDTERFRLHQFAMELSKQSSVIKQKASYIPSSSLSSSSSSLIPSLSTSKMFINTDNNEFENIDFKSNNVTDLIVSDKKIDDIIVSLTPPPPPSSLSLSSSSNINMNEMWKTSKILSSSSSSSFGQLLKSKSNKTNDNYNDDDFDLSARAGLRKSFENLNMNFDGLKSSASKVLS